MIQVSGTIFTLIFFTSILGMVIAGILYFLNRNSSLSPRLLAGYIFLLALTTLAVGLTFTSFYLRFPHLWRSTAWTSFCGPAVAYLYVRSVIRQSFRLQKWDWILFVPALLYTLNLLPYYVKSAAEKYEVVSRFMVDKTLIAREPEGLLPEGWGIGLKMIFGLTLVILQYSMLAKIRSKIIIPGHMVKQNETTFRWLVLFTSVLCFFYLLLIGEYIFHLGRVINLNTAIYFTISGTIFFISLYLLARPSILYGMQGWFQEPDIHERVQAMQTHYITEEKRTSLSVEQGNVYKEALESHLGNNHPFRKPGYKIRDLSEDLDIPTYQLSAFINQEYGQNFNELINDYRVDFMASQLIKNPEKFQFTLEALANEAGFNSRSSFYNAVKKKTGKTPAEFFGFRGQVSTP